MSRPPAIRSEEAALQCLVEAANEETFGGGIEDDLECGDDLKQSEDLVDGGSGLGGVKGEDAAAAAAAEAAFPNYICKYTTQHKDSVLCADISGDGQYAATGGADQCLKLLRVPHMHQHFQLQRDTGGGSQAIPQQQQPTRDRAVAKNFIDHSGPILDIQFHPLEPVVASASQRTVKFFRHFIAGRPSGANAAGGPAGSQNAFQTLNVVSSLHRVGFLLWL